MTTTVHKFGTQPVTCHAWSADRTRLALSQSSKAVQVYRAAGAGWEVEQTLDQHDLRVTGIDWAPNTNRIVTCSADRNAYVWEREADGSWRHKLVVLRINRAATCVRWSPRENKFAVGSGAKMVCVCYYDDENGDWWVAKHLKKPLKSTVTALDWHPNNVLLCAGSTDFNVCVFSAYVKEIEEKPSQTEWGVKMTFGNVMAKFANSAQGGGWVHSVAFSHDGSKVAWVGHDSSVNIADAGNGMRVAKLKTAQLPMLSVVWISANSVLAAGHNYTPGVFTLRDGGRLEDGGALSGQKKTGAATLSNAMKKFRDMDVRGQSAAENSSQITSVHENQVCEVRVYREDGQGGVQAVSSCAQDGRLVLWDINNKTFK